MCLLRVESIILRPEGMCLTVLFCEITYVSLYTIDICWIVFNGDVLCRNMSFIYIKGFMKSDSTGLKLSYDI